MLRFGFKSTPPAFLCHQLCRSVCGSKGATGVCGLLSRRCRAVDDQLRQPRAGMLPAVGMDGLICGMQMQLDTPLRRRDDPPGKSGAKYIRNKQAKARRCKRDADIVEMKKVQLNPQTWHWLTKMSCRTICFVIRMTGTSQQRKVFCTYCEEFSVIKAENRKIFVCPQCKQRQSPKRRGEPPTMRDGGTQVIQNQR